MSNKLFILLSLLSISTLSGCTLINEYKNDSSSDSKTETSTETDAKEETETIVYPDGYSRLSFHDEFEGSSLNTEYWGFDIGNGSNGWGNGEIEYYTNHNHTVSDGMLTITAKKEGNSYTSSRLLTKDKVRLKYGYIEARISLPIGSGLWPAFWMMPNNSTYGGWPRSGEIDIMEARGRVPNEVSSALHFTQYESDAHTYLTRSYTLSSDFTNFHLYAVKWEEESISFFVDNEMYFSVSCEEWQTYSALSNSKAPFDQDFYIIINLALGGQFDNYVTPLDTVYPTDMKIDYVRWFQK